MLDLNKEYWENRTKEKGHTGWADPLIYSYDQKIRLNTIEYILKVMSIRGGSALDYGCGTGDFCVLLSKYFDSVTGTDLSDNVLKIAADSNNRKNIIYSKLNYDIIFNKKYDLILSITVLQHILDDNDLILLMKNFSEVLSNNGIILVLESFCGNDEKENINEYIKIRSNHHFENLVKSVGLKVVNSYNFYNPLNTDINFNNFFFKVLRRLVLYKIPFSKLLMKYFMKKLTHNKNGIVNNDTKTKILILANDK